MDRTHGLANTWKEGRRQRALELKQHGWKQCEIAAALGASAAAVSQWVAKARAHGSEAWRAKPRPTGPVKLTPDQLPLVPALVSHGAEADGFRGECWTWARVATGRWAACGLSYHKAPGSRLLKRRDWTPPMPLERATPRDEAVIKRWRVAVGPALKKGAPRRSHEGLGGRVGLFSLAGPGPHLRAMRTAPDPAGGIHA